VRNLDEDSYDYDEETAGGTPGEESIEGTGT